MSNVIELKHLSKAFGSHVVLRDISMEVKKGDVTCIIGASGSGKSTFLRMACGVLKADKGEILVDEQPIYENVSAKKDIFYISDDQFYLLNSTPKDMMHFYADYYQNFDKKRCLEMLDKFGLKANRHVSTFSKGMKKQLSVILGVCANTNYLFCDETFDGLDPVMRQAVKSIFVGEMTERDFTPVIASHNLRELEDICDCVGILHHGGVLMQKDLEEMDKVIDNLSDETFDEFMD